MEIPIGLVSVNAEQYERLLGVVSAKEEAKAVAVIKKIILQIYLISLDKNLIDC